MTLTDFATRLKNVKSTNGDGSFSALCPAHDDANASLSVTSRDGNILLTCHAGCSFADIAASLNIPQSEFFANPIKSAGYQRDVTDQIRRTHTYIYRNAKGKYIFEVWRYTPKSFRQWRRKYGTEIAVDRWLELGPTKFTESEDKPAVMGVGKKEMALYRLPELISHRTDHITLGETPLVFVVEGEKDVESLRALGYCATSNAGGACTLDEEGYIANKKWPQDATQYFNDCDVIVIPDSDKAGVVHATGVCNMLKQFSTAKSVKWLDLPRATKDVTLFLEKHTKDDFEKLLRTTTAPREHYTHDEYYDHRAKQILIKDNDDVWQHRTEQQYRDTLLNRGLSDEKLNGKLISPLTNYILKLRDSRAIDYAGPIAGRRSGFQKMCGYRVMITRSPDYIHPVEGNWDTIQQIIEGLVCNCDYTDQAKWIYAWIKQSWECYRDEVLRPAPALALAGPAGCGKSLLQTIITWILGGREAKPYQMMTGATSFNQDCIESAHLRIDDETPLNDIKSRRQFANSLKQLTASSTGQRCHSKGKDAIVLQPFWRVTISLNDELENLSVLPPIDGSMKGKIIILKCTYLPMPLPTTTNEEYIAFSEKIKEELPAFLWSMERFVPPPDTIESRYGLAAWQHPQLLQALVELSPEGRLLDLIDKVYFTTLLREKHTLPLEEIEKTLRSSDYSIETNKLLYTSSAMMRYMSRLWDQFPERVEHVGNNWVINPPR